MNNVIRVAYSDASGGVQWSRVTCHFIHLDMENARCSTLLCGGRQAAHSLYRYINARFEDSSLHCWLCLETMLL